MSRESESVVDFEPWMNSVGLVFSTQLTGEQKMKFLNHVVGLCSAAEINEFSVGLPGLLYRDFITLMPKELSHVLLSYFDIKTLLTACQVCRNWNRIISDNIQLWRQRSMLSGFRIPEERREDVLFYKKLFRRNSLVHWWKCSWNMVQLEGHGERVMALYYYNGRVATGGDDRTVRIWCCKTGQCLSVFTTHSVSAIKFDDRFLVTASFDRTAASWDVRTGEQLRCYTGHVAGAFCIDFDARLDILVTGSADATLKIWSFSKGDLLRTLEHHPGSSNELVGLWMLSVRLCDMNWDGRFGVLASNNRSVFCWVMDALSTTVLTSEVVFEALSFDNRLVGWEFDGSFLTVGSQMDLLDQNAIKETTYEFSKSAGGKFVVRKSNVFPLSKEIEIYIYLGSGKCFSVFFGERNQEEILYITRRDAEIPPVLMNFPSQFRPTKTVTDNTVTLCDRDWMDGISSDIFGQSFLAVVFSDDSSIRVAKLDSHERQP